jgi:hypothetical protein
LSKTGTDLFFFIFLLCYAENLHGRRDERCPEWDVSYYPTIRTTRKKGTDLFFSFATLKIFKEGEVKDAQNGTPRITQLPAPRCARTKNGTDLFFSPLTR